MKYKITYSGFAYVESDNDCFSEEDAIDLFNDEEYIYDEFSIDTVEEASEFAISIDRTSCANE